MRAPDFYRVLLRCYPAPFRQEYGAEMQHAFGDQLAEAGRRGGRRAQAALWLRAIADATRVAPGEHWHVLAQDLRFAVRAMASRPAFALTAIATLAVGIGANAAVFSLWNGLLRAPLAGVRAPDELVMLTDPDERGSWTGRWNGRTDGPRAWVTYQEFQQLRDESRRFGSMMASQSSLNTWQIRVNGGAPEEARGRLVSGAFFDVLGVRPAIGRLFTDDDDRADTPHAVLSHAYWTRRFGGQHDAIGATLRIRNATVTVIGIAHAGFMGETSGQHPDLWLPLRLQPSVLPGRDRLHDTPPVKSMWLQVFGRLQDGVTPAEAEGEANAIFQAGLEAFDGTSQPDPGAPSRRDEHLRLQPGGRGASAMRPLLSDSLSALLAGVGVLLLIACVNIANLLLARAASRRAEMALRVSLGASRSRLVRQLVTESLVLAAAGAVAAIGVATALHAALMRMATSVDGTFAMPAALNPVVLVFLLTITLIAALVSGGLPAWQITRSEPGEGLAGHGRGTVGTRRQARTSRWLVGLQLALSLPLLVGAGLLVRTAHNLQHAELGYPAERLLLVRVDLSDVTEDPVAQGRVRRDLRERLARVPGVVSVSHSQLGIFTGGLSTASVEVEGHRPTGDLDRQTSVDLVGPGYVATLGAGMLLGRDLAESDQSPSTRVCVINGAFAGKFFGPRHPLGRYVTLVEDGERTAYQVVGVAADAHTDDVRAQIQPRVYLPSEQPPQSSQSPTFLVRTARDGPALLPSLRAAVEEVSPSTPVIAARSIQQRLEPLVAQDRSLARLALIFGGIALGLAAIGLYGVLSFGVARRTPEIAVRMALGAQARGVIAMILRESMAVVSAGLIAGGVLAIGASRLVGSRLYGVAPEDPVTLLLAVLLLLAVAVVATCLPARRAARVDPVSALRQD